MLPRAKWSILVLTVPQREERFLKLMGTLLPQAEAVYGQVEVIALRDCGGKTPAQLSQLRQWLLNDAFGEFCSFVDDDDMVEPDYVKSVLTALEDEPLADFVSFNIAFYEGEKLDPRPVVTGLRLKRWADSPDTYFRDITHINPVRTEIARKAGFADGNGPEDWRYVETVRPLLAGSVEAEIPRVLYHYRHNWRDSVQGSNVRLCTGRRMPIIVSPVFRWHFRSHP